MNGGGDEMEEDGRIEGGKREAEGDSKEKTVLMWGYLPGVSPQRSPLFSPAAVPMPKSVAGDSWRDVCGGGCGFAMAISESGKLFTWGSTDDMGQSYVAAGKHEEVPEAFPLPSELAIVKAAAGWAHCVAVTAYGEVYTWGWKECVPSGKLIGDQLTGGIPEKDDKQSGLLSDQVSPRSHTRSHVSGASSGTISSQESSKVGEESTKRRKISSAKQAPESSTSGDEALSAPPCLVTLNAGVRIVAVAAGGRHTLALSDVGQVWGWGYGGEGQLGLGSRIRMVSSPHPIPCIESIACGKERSSMPTKTNASSEGQVFKVAGSCVKAIACGGRHSAVVTDTGAILTFGWGLYGQVRFLAYSLLVYSMQLQEHAFLFSCGTCQCGTCHDLPYTISCGKICLTCPTEADGKGRKFNEIIGELVKDSDIESGAIFLQLFIKKVKNETHTLLQDLF